MSAPKPGTVVTVRYLSTRTGTAEVTGTVLNGRYPHLYLTLEVDGQLVRLPHSLVLEVK